MCMLSFFRCPVGRVHEGELVDENSGLIESTPKLCAVELRALTDALLNDKSTTPRGVCSAGKLEKVFCHDVAIVCDQCAEKRGQPGIFGESGRPLWAEDITSEGADWPRAQDYLLWVLRVCEEKGRGAIWIYSDLQAVLEDIEEQLADETMEEPADEMMEEPTDETTEAPADEPQVQVKYPHPTTAQARLPDRFYNEHRNTPGVQKWYQRYAQVLPMNRGLTEPITYETLEQYQKRQKGVNKRYDALLTEGEYWKWFMDRRNYCWLPRDAVGMTHRGNLSSRKPGIHDLPQDHQWVVDDEFRTPSAWFEYVPNSGPRLPVVRKLYLIAYSKAFWTSRPLPFETRRLFISRQHRFTKEAYLKPKNLDATYDRWLNEPQNERMRWVEKNRTLVALDDELLDRLHQGFR